MLLHEYEKRIYDKKRNNVSADFPFSDQIQKSHREKGFLLSFHITKKSYPLWERLNKYLEEKKELHRHLLWFQM